MFPIDRVPIPGQAQPFQIPQHYDPAQIIMQAATLRQQKELTQEKMNQEMLQNVIGSIQIAASLYEKRREAEAANAIAQGTLNLQQQKTTPEIELLRAHTSYFNSMAGGGGDAVQSAVNMLKSGLASPTDIYSLASRWPQGQKLQLMKGLADSGIDLKGLGLDLTAQKSAITTQESSSIQQRIRGAESILPNFQNVIDMANKLGLGTFAPANKIKLAALRQVNDPDVIKYDTTRSAVSEEMGRYFGGGTASDMKIRLGKEILGNDGVNAEAIQSALMGEGGAYSVIQNQAKAYKNIAPTTRIRGQSAQNNNIVTRILPSGQQVRVVDNGDGTFTEAL